MLAALGIIKGQPFQPDTHSAICSIRPRKPRTTSATDSYQPQTLVPNGIWYEDRRWVNVFPGNATFTADTFNFIDPRTGFFTNAYSASPGMAVDMVNVGAKYPATFVDADGNFLGDSSYKLHSAAGHPCGAVLVGDRLRLDHRIGLDNGQPFPSINTMDRPQQNADGSTDIYFGPNARSKGSTG